jgi:hypothetical protein
MHEHSHIVPRQGLTLAPRHRKLRIRDAEGWSVAARATEVITGTLDVGGILYALILAFKAAASGDLRRPVVAPTLAVFCRF